jgi:hypothetical protein
MFTETCWIPALKDAPAANRITMALREADGVVRVRADLPNRRLVVTYDAPATPEALRALMESLGFAVASGLTALYPPE